MLTNEPYCKVLPKMHFWIKYFF